MMKNFGKLLMVSLLVTIFIGSTYHQIPVNAKPSSQISIINPKPGSMIADILTVEIQVPNENLEYTLFIISISGQQEKFPLVSDEGGCFVNLDTRNFKNGNYYLYIVGKSKELFILDSDVLQIMIDNTQSSIKSDVKPAYVSSGNLIHLYLYADLQLNEVYAELENGIRLNLIFNQEASCWEENYFVPMTYLDRTYIVSFYAKDIHNKSIICPSSAFTICNAEPVIEFPPNKGQFIKSSTQISGYFRPGETVNLFKKIQNPTSPEEVKYQFLASTVTDSTGNWLIENIPLTKGINEFLVSNRKTNSERVLYPKQKTSIQYFPDGLIVLNYHDIQPKGGTYAKSKEAFELDMQYIQKNGFNPVSPTVFLNFLEGKAELPNKPVLITFDDGLKGVYQYAYPILKAYGYQAMLFIIVSRIDNNPDYLTWKEIYELQSSRVFSIESHTFNSHFFVDDENGRHAALVSYLTLPDGSIETNDQYKKRIIDDLNKSKEMIEEKLDKKVHFLSIPFGIGNQSLNVLLLQADFKGSFTSGGGVNPLPFNSWDIKRITILNTDDLDELIH
ncbi:polysaccharide deacetylase family protein [bacterium]|nr:polysaccharide deacetylase family protein [bacterium]